MRISLENNEHNILPSRAGCCEDPDAMKDVDLEDAHKCWFKNIVSSVSYLVIQFNYSSG